MLHCGPGQYIQFNGPVGAGGSSAGKVCANCTAGKYASAVDSLSCEACSSGLYSVPGASRCLPCPLNYYSSGTGAANCTACRLGAGRNGVYGGTSEAQCLPYGMMLCVMSSHGGSAECSNPAGPVCTGLSSQSNGPSAVVDVTCNLVMQLRAVSPDPFLEYRICMKGLAAASASAATVWTGCSG